MITYKIEVLPALKAKGYTTYKLRKDKIIGEAQIQKLRSGQLVSMEVLNILCKLLDCQPGDILKYEDD